MVKHRKSQNSTIEKYLPLLKLISSDRKGENAGKVIPFLTDDSVENLCECVFNVIFNPNIKMSKQKKTKLKTFLKSNCSSHNIRKIATKKVPLSKRRRYLQMEGKGLPMLIATALSSLLPLIFGK